MRNRARQTDSQTDRDSDIERGSRTMRGRQTDREQNSRSNRPKGGQTIRKEGQTGGQRQRRRG